MNKLIKVINSNIKNLISIIKWMINYFEEKRLINFPRYTATYAALFNKKILIADSASFLFLKREIFKSEIYRFKSTNPKPYIIDCGANIGMSVIYFKKLYPDCEVIAFEPDKRIIDILKFNLCLFGYSDVKVYEYAVWNKNTNLKFFSEGADGGRIAINGDNKNIINITCTSLRKYIHKTVNFLKIDIEGAEVEVLEDCKNLLHFVENIYIEFHSFINKKQGLDKILRIMQRSGFRYFISHVGIFSPHPFYEKYVSLGMDNQLHIFATRNKLNTIQI